MQPDVAKWGGVTGSAAALLSAVGGSGLLEPDTNPNPQRAGFPVFTESLRGNRMALPEGPGIGITELPGAPDRFRTPHATVLLRGHVIEIAT